VSLSLKPLYLYLLSYLLLVFFLFILALLAMDFSWNIDFILALSPPLGGLSITTYFIRNIYIHLRLGLCDSILAERFPFPGVIFFALSAPSFLNDNSLFDSSGRFLFFSACSFNLRIALGCFLTIGFLVLISSLTMGSSALISSLTSLITMGSSLTSSITMGSSSALISSLASLITMGSSLTSSITMGSSSALISSLASSITMGSSLTSSITMGSSLTSSITMGSSSALISSLAH